MSDRQAPQRLPPGAGFTSGVGTVVLSPKDETRQIRTMDAWLEWAGPLGGRSQWTDGRSAKEVARAWCGDGCGIAVPAELRALLASNSVIGPIEVATVIPELPTYLGDVSRGPRRHDLVLLGLDGHGAKTLVGVEAKADESFDDLVSVRVRRNKLEARKAELAGRPYPSALRPRIARLSRALLGREAFSAGGELDPVVGHIPYQLLAGFAGTLIEAEARHAELATFVVHAFESNLLDPVRVSANNAGFQHFASLIPDLGLEPIRIGELRGPVLPPGGEGIPRIPALIGLAVTQLGSCRLAPGSH